VQMDSLEAQRETMDERKRACLDWLLARMHRSEQEMSWLLWQSVHTAALSEPAATARPCTLSSYERNGCVL